MIAHMDPNQGRQAARQKAGRIFVLPRLVFITFLLCLMQLPIWRQLCRPGQSAPLPSTLEACS